MSNESKNPEQPEGFTHFQELLESVQQMDAMLKANSAQAEEERLEVVGVRYEDGTILSAEDCGTALEVCAKVQTPLMTVAQHERIVGELRAVIAQLRQHKNDYMDSGQETYRALQNEIREREAEIARLDGLVSGRTAERDAAQARVAGLEAELETERMRLAACGTAALGYFDGCADAYKSASLSDVLRLRGDCDAALARVAEFEAQAQHSVPVVTPEMVMAAMAVFRLDVSPFKSMEAALIAALRKAAAPGKEVGHE
ncbi:hypothetical protein [Pseudomonas aeruginosa]|uniref:hypothetical protein n=1 Tax=Pseudomonas aeruginosa TaxID=287 RepID=UPI0029BFBC69|nr:hypothetical protein [Pseudomonas aeruginosa]